MKRPLLLLACYMHVYLPASAPVKETVDSVTYQEGTLLKRNITIEKKEGSNWVTYTRKLETKIFDNIVTQSVVYSAGKVPLIICTKYTNTGKIEGFRNYEGALLREPAVLQYLKKGEEKGQFYLLKTLYENKKDKASATKQKGLK